MCSSNGFFQIFFSAHIVVFAFNCHFKTMRINEQPNKRYPDERRLTYIMARLVYKLVYFQSHILKKLNSNLCLK